MRQRGDPCASSARALAEHRYGEARHTVEAFRARRAAPPGAERRRGSGAGASGAPRPRSAEGSPREQAGRRAQPSRPEYEQAQRLVARADRNEARHGERWSERDLQRFDAEDRELLRSSRDPADHAHRAGYERRPVRKPARRPSASARRPRSRGRAGAISKRLAIASSRPAASSAGAGSPPSGCARELKGRGQSAARSCRRLRRERRAADTWPRAAISAEAPESGTSTQPSQVGLFLLCCAALVLAAACFSGGGAGALGSRATRARGGFALASRNAASTSTWALCAAPRGVLSALFLAMRWASSVAGAARRCAPTRRPTSRRSSSPARRGFPHPRRRLRSWRTCRSSCSRLARRALSSAASPCARELTERFSFRFEARDGVWRACGPGRVKRGVDNARPLAIAVGLIGRTVALKVGLAGSRRPARPDLRRRPLRRSRAGIAGGGRRGMHGSPAARQERSRQLLAVAAEGERPLSSSARAASRSSPRSTRSSPTSAARRCPASARGLTPPAQPGPGQFLAETGRPTGSTPTATAARYLQRSRLGLRNRQLPARLRRPPRLARGDLRLQPRRVVRRRRRIEGRRAAAARSICTPSPPALGGEALVRRSDALSAARLQADPVELWVGGGAPQAVDERIWPNVVWVLESSRLRVTAAQGVRARDPRRRHRARPGARRPGRTGMRRRCAAAEALGWRSACGASGTAPVCPLVPGDSVHRLQRLPQPRRPRPRRRQRPPPHLLAGLELRLRRCSARRRAGCGSFRSRRDGVGRGRRQSGVRAARPLRSAPSLGQTPVDLRVAPPGHGADLAVAVAEAEQGERPRSCGFSSASRAARSRSARAPRPVRAGGEGSPIALLGPGLPPLACAAARRRWRRDCGRASSSGASGSGSARPARRAAVGVEVGDERARRRPEAPPRRPRGWRCCAGRSPGAASALGVELFGDSPWRRRFGRLVEG